MTENPIQKTTRLIALTALSMVVLSQAHGQEAPLAWGSTQYFQYNLESVTVSGSAVKVIFSVSNPLDPVKPLWDIKADAPFTAGRSSRLGIDIGWDATEFRNTGSNSGSLNPIVQPATGGAGAALPVTLNALTASKLCTAADCPGIPAGNHYWAVAQISPLAFPSGATPSTGVVAIEGHPACTPVLTQLGCPAPVLINGVLTPGNIPVKSVVRSFSLTGGTPSSRRQIVDINKCKVCHNGSARNGKVIPRLSLHGANRNEELGLCVVCHNPNQTDIPYRTSGAEVSIDFKRMVHSIHAGGFRRTPFSVVGFQGTVFDFSTVRFPADLKNCVNCHIDQNGKGTFELPLKPEVLGSTINTQSAAGFVNVDPYSHLKITPTAATCSGCHDSSEVQRHMVRTGGASFSTLQQNIIPGVTERCVNCHGPGREEDVRRAHEIRRSSGSSGSRD